MDYNISHRHALKFTLLSTIEQQRIMKKLEKQARAYHKATQTNAEPTEALVYHWHRKVRLARESRSLALLRAFLKGVPYIKVEHKNHKYTLPPVIIMQDYGPIDVVDETFEEFKRWVNDERV